MSVENTDIVWGNLPAGTRITTSRGRMVAASPDEPPYFIDFDWSDPLQPKPLKTPIDLDAPPKTVAAHPVLWSWIERL